MSNEESSAIVALSNSLTAAVESAGRHVVRVSARRRGSASGIVWRTGIVVTADHVVERDDGITIRTAAGDSITATLAGRDPTTDIAVLKIPEGDSDQGAAVSTEPAVVGQLVAAVARPGESGLSVSFGVISSVGPEWRTWGGGRIDQLVRPQLTFYPGFSGGALIDMNGRVLGLNTSGLSRGMDVTIPAGTLNRVVDQLLKTGRIAPGFLGVRMQSVDVSESVRSAMGIEPGQGLLVVGVEDDGPAAKAGLMVGDVLLTIDGKRVEQPDSVAAILDPDKVGKQVALRVSRGGNPQDLTAVVAERPHQRHHHG